MSYISDGSHEVNTKSPYPPVFISEADRRLQQQLDLIADRLRLNYENLGTPLVYHSGQWWTFHRGARRALDGGGRQEMAVVIKNAAAEAGLTFTRQHQSWISHDLKARMVFMPPGRKLFSRQVWPPVPYGQQNRAAA